MTANRLSAEDRMDVLDLLARYGQAMDGTDPQAFLDCFIPDAELDIGYRTVKGADELREFADYFAAKPGRPWYHHITTTTFSGDAERVHTRSYLLMTSLDAEGKSQVHGCAVYLDEFVKHEGNWLFARHTVET